MAMHYFKRITNQYKLLNTFSPMKFILWFDEITHKDIAKVGGKGANLGEMYNKLKGVLIPAGFAITADAYKFLLKETKLDKQIKEILKTLNTKDIRNLQEKGKAIRSLFLKTKFPKELEEAILTSYRKMPSKFKYETNPNVAVRSSATAEDLPRASFAGQQDTYLNIKGEKQLLDSCRKCFASLFTDRAISYRADKGFDHMKVYLSITVQKMVHSEASGVMFTIDTESGHPDVVFINSAYGLGENVVQGKVDPDEFYVHKPTLKKGFKSIISKNVGDKKWRLIYSEHGTKNVLVQEKDRKKFSITDDEALTLAKWACMIEDHYKMPMDIEWAKDEKLGRLFILQARPETVHAMQKKQTYNHYSLLQKGKLLLTGHSVGEKIGCGKVVIVNSLNDLRKVKKGDVLVAEMTSPDYEPLMKIASAIITNRGGRVCHAAILSRELGIPAIVGTEKATSVLKTGQNVTVDCSVGDIGEIYEGLLKFEVKDYDLRKLPKTKTKILVNVGMPEDALSYGMLPVDGVGLAREEFIINSYIGIHPLALLNYNKLPLKIKEKISKLTEGYSNKAQFYIDRLASGIAQISAAFYPRPVIVRFSDFKSNEYRNLIGGELFEPHEENPMIGWRGASRYYDPKFKPAFDLECYAINKVRKEYGLTNVIVEIPFCRTVEEAIKVKKIIRTNKIDAKIYMMCEIPSDAILVERFSKIFDSYSLGTNDLTQLVLGVDRDSELVANVYDESNEAVKKMIKEFIKKAHHCGKEVGICGEAPASVKGFIKFLIEAGIDSISVNPDSVIKTRLKVAKEEK